MGFIDKTQNLLVEIVGTVIFIVGAGFFVYGLIKGFNHGWYIDVVAIVIGLMLMGYMKLGKAIAKTFQK